MEDINTQQQEAVLTEEQKTAQILGDLFPNDDDFVEEQQNDDNANNDGGSQDDSQQQQQSDEGTQQQQAQPLDTKEYLKKFSVESEEELQQLIEKAKKPIEPTKPTFANADSEAVYNMLLEGKVKEVTAILKEQEKIEALLTSSVDNVAIAEEIVKLNMKDRFKELSDAEIDRKFKKQYSIPKQPVKTDIESEEDYQERLDEWNDAKREVEQDLIIDAKVIKPEIEKLKKNIELPKAQAKEIVDDGGLTDEQIQQQRTQYLETLNKDFSKFEGIKVPVKDEEVDLTVTYVLDDQEKTQIRAMAENFDAEDYFGKRWITKEGNPNVSKIIEDLSLLEYGSKMFQKVGRQSIAEAKVKWAAEKKNIDLDKGGQSGASSQQQLVYEDEQDGLAAAFWSKK
jgi:hypothetical protein